MTAIKVSGIVPWGMVTLPLGNSPKLELLTNCKEYAKCGFKCLSIHKRKKFESVNTNRVKYLNMSFRIFDRRQAYCGPIINHFYVIDA